MHYFLQHDFFAMIDVRAEEIFLHISLFLSIEKKTGNIDRFVPVHL